MGNFSAPGRTQGFSDRQGDAADAASAFAKPLTQPAARSLHDTSLPSGERNALRVRQGARLFLNLRSKRQAAPRETFPAARLGRGLGNSLVIASERYLQTTNNARRTSKPPPSSIRRRPNPAALCADPPRAVEKPSKPGKIASDAPLKNPGKTVISRGSVKILMGDTGPELMKKSREKQGSQKRTMRIPMHAMQLTPICPR